MRSIQIVHSVVSEASGPSYSVTRLAEALAARGVDSQMVSLAAVAGQQTYDGVSRRTFCADRMVVPQLAQLGFSQAMRRALAEAAKTGVVLHAHGLWRMTNVYPGWAASRASAPLVLSPRGMLGADALKFSRLQKRIFWQLLQARAVRPVRCFHATCHAELEDIRAFGLTAPVAIIPNGIDVPETPDDRAAQPAGRTVLYLGRIHPKKGIDRLLLAWTQIEADHPDWRLRIVGPSERNHVAELAKLAAERGLTRVTFEEPLFGADKHHAYAAADLFVLPTLHENFGIVVAEALAQGTPVICTRGAPWQGLEREGCGWWIEHGPDAMAATLKLALGKSPQALQSMGERGRRWMRRDFSWEQVAESMERLYGWCSGSGDMPEFVTQ